MADNLKFKAAAPANSCLSDAASVEVDAVRQPLGDLPLIVLSAVRLAPDLEAWAEAGYAMYDEIAALSTRGERRTIDSGHAIQIEKPEAVIAAIEEGLALARGG